MKKKRNYKVSIIIPCYNEEGNIEVLYRAIKSEVSSENLEFVFVDDFSNDNTLIIIEKIAHLDKSVKYLSLSRNFGHQNALRAGLEYASGECVISIDADLQHPPRIVNSMIERWKNGFEVVYTIRKNHENVSLLKRLSSNIFYKILNYFSDVSIKNGSADFRLLDRKVVEVLKHDVNEYHLFYRGLIKWVGFKQIAIEYTSNKRHTGKSKYSLKKMIALAINGITSFSVKPLKYAIFLGLFLSIITAVYSIYILYASFFTDDTIEGWTSVILSVLFIGGVNMVLLGIIGEYIGKIFIQVKNRPHFIVRKSNF